MNHNFIYYFIFLIIGLVSGLLFFLGLWLTIKNLAKAKNPIPLILLSYFIRMIFIGSIFYLTIKTGNYLYTIIVLLGFIISRFFISKKIKRKINF